MDNMEDRIRKYYRESFGALRKARSAIFIALVLFFGGIVAGLMHPSWADGNLDLLKGIAKQMYGQSLYVIIAMIFLRNSLSAVLSIALGPLLGIVPLLGAALNGLLAGLTFTYISEANTVKALLQLFPHGIFELPAIFMAWGLGIWQGIWVFQQNVQPSFHERRTKAFRILFTIIMPLLLIAAAIEGISIHALLQR
jgi:stage II sporulation protein M